MDKSYQRKQGGLVGRPMHNPTDRLWFNAFIVGWNMLFGIPVYLAIHLLTGLRIPGHSLITYHGPSLILLGLSFPGFMELARAWRSSVIFRSPRITFAIKAYCVVLVVMALQIPSNMAAGASLVTVIRSATTWLLPVVAVFGIREEYWRTIRKVLCWQSAIGCVLMLILLPKINAEVLQSNPDAERLNLLEVGGGVLWALNDLKCSTTFMLLSFWSLTPIWRLVALVMGGITFWMALIGQFRSASAMVLLALIIGLLYVPFRTLKRKGKRPVGLASVVIMVGVLLVGLVVAQTHFKGAISIASEFVDAVIKRGVTTSDEGLQSSWDIRVEESREALSESSPLQWIVGKGFGATWSGGSLYDTQRGLCHFGVGHLMLYGGVFLMIIVYAGPILKGWRVILTSRQELVLICAGVVCIRSLSTFVANIFDADISYMLLMLCVGGLFLRRDEFMAREGRNVR